MVGYLSLILTNTPSHHTTMAFSMTNTYEELYVSPITREDHEEWTPVFIPLESEDEGIDCEHDWLNQDDDYEEDEEDYWVAFAEPHEYNRVFYQDDDEDEEGVELDETAPMVTTPEELAEVRDFVARVFNEFRYEQEEAHYDDDSDMDEDLDPIPLGGY